MTKGPASDSRALKLTLGTLMWFVWIRLYVFLATVVGGMVSYAFGARRATPVPAGPQRILFVGVLVASLLVLALVVGWWGAGMSRYAKLVSPSWWVPSVTASFLVLGLGLAAKQFLGIGFSVLTALLDCAAILLGQALSMWVHGRREVSAASGTASPAAPASANS